MTKVRKWQKKPEPYRRILFAILNAAAYPQSSGGSNKDVVEDSHQFVRHCDELLEYSCIQRYLEDWVGLAAINHDSSQHCPDRAKFALMVATAHIQKGNRSNARQFIQLAQNWGCNKKLIGQVLISGAFDELGSMALALGQLERAQRHFTASAKIIGQCGDSALVKCITGIRERLSAGTSSHATDLSNVSTNHTSAPNTFGYPSEGIVSYAQNFEDVMLWRALGRVQNGFYVDVGAQDPVVNSVSKAFYDRGWRGIHVEPNVEYAQALRKARPEEEVIESILAADAVELVFHRIPNTGISTGKKEFADRHRQGGWEVLELPMTATTLAEVFERTGQRDIHWLKVDVEGMEDDVLRGWRNHAARPWIVVAEATEPLSQTPNWHVWEHQLLNRDYVFVYFDGLNRFYVHAKHKDLMQAFNAPPNVFDGFRRI